MGETLEDAILSAFNKKDILLHSPNGSAFMEIPDPISSDHDVVIDEIYAFASQFVGHEDRELRSEEHIDPLTISPQAFVDFFAAADTIWVMANTESEQARFLELVKKHDLQEVITNVGKDTERVAEALLIAIARKQAELEKDGILSGLVGEFDAYLDSERTVEDLIDDIMPSHVSAVIAKEKVKDTEKRMEGTRLDVTNEIFIHISPLLKTLKLKSPIRNWMHFSNSEE